MSQEISVTAIIEDVAEDISSHLKNEKDAINHQQLEHWMTAHGLGRVDSPDKTICELAAFNRLLKTTLYQIYRQDGEELPPLDSETDIYAELVKAHAKTQDHAFRENELDGLVEPIPDVVFTPLLEIRDYLISKNTCTEEVGSIFESLVPQKARRRLGQFRTPKYIAEFMAEWAVQNADDRVLDPGIGAGILTAAMYDAKQEAIGKPRVEDMWGVDLSDLSVVMSSTALKIANGDGSPNFIQDNFMDTIAEGKPQRTDQENPHVLPIMDAVVSNPPYSRSIELTVDEKARINRIAEAEAGMSISLKAPMYHYFFVHAAQFLEDGGRMAFITPARFMETKYGIELRRFLLDNFAIHGLILLDGEITVFEDADTDPCITFLEKTTATHPEFTTTFIKADEWPGGQELIEAIWGEVQGQTSYGFVNHVVQQEIVATFNWTDYVDPASVEAIPGLKSFRDIATIKRGIATGMNDYFCLSQTEADKWELDEDQLVPLIRRTEKISGYDLRTHEDWDRMRDDGDAVWLLYCYNEDGGPITENDDHFLKEYLKHGEEIGADESYLAKNRSPWYVVDERSPPDILVTYMSKNGFRFILNEAGVVSLNNLHNVYLDGYTRREIDALLAYLNSSVANEIAKRSGRTYSRGLHKIEPNELKSIPVMDPNELSQDDIHTLSNTFRKVCEAARDAGMNLTEAKRELDEAVIRAINPSQRTLHLPRRGTD